ncbi:MAG: ribosome maturation factor RimP [Leptolyngbya sp. RL_3_1]|nr:ribosome maturation factor RimP [Leptolyngbya sp. RL_3_1]
MTHPLIPDLLDLAKPIADQLNLDIVEAVFQTNQSPPVLRVDIRNRHQADTGLDDCEQMSHALDEALEASGLMPGAYVLEVSSPGVSPILSTDRDFSTFKGFMVEADLQETYKNKITWIGQLISRDEHSITLSQKGRPIKIPRSLVSVVRLSNQAP